MLFAATVSVMAAACSVHELDLPDHSDTHEKVKIQVVPSIQGMDEVQTKSSVTSGESAVKDINIFFYHNGLLVASNYVVTPAVASFLLNEGLEYNVYAVANVGKITPMDKEVDFIKYKMTIGSSGFVGTMNAGGIPMAWQKSGYTVSKSVTQLPVVLVRLVSKIRFKVDMQALAGLKVTSIRLCNGAGSITPFTMNGHGGSKITAANESINGDYASVADLNSINSGGQIYFYALENCQGTLLSGNKDPWKKTPENISVANLCTYLEVNCEFQAGFALTGTITYRVYLGQDNCTNFDIIRNVDMGVTLCLTKNLDNVSWKIDPDVDYNGTMGRVWVEKGLHGTDDLYVGETVLLGLDINQYLEDFLGKGLKGYKIAVLNNGEPCDHFRFGDIVYSSGDYFCEMTCRKETGGDSFSMWITDSDGKMITDLSPSDGDIACSYPELTVGDGKRYRPSEMIIAPQMKVCPVVNGSNDNVYLYLTDSRGHNLNCDEQEGQYRFDLSYFSNMVMAAAPTALTIAKTTTGAAAVAAAYSASFTKGTSMDNGPAFKAVVKMSNPGTNAALCRNLSNIYHISDYHAGGNELAELTFAAVNTVAVKTTADFEIVRPKFYLADKSTFQPSNGYTMFGMTYIAAYNPSNIDYWADVIYVGKRKSSQSSSIIDGVSLINFRSNTNPGYYLPTATRTIAYPYLADCSSAALQHTNANSKGIVIEGKSCDVFIMDRIGGVSKLSETDGNKAFMRAEVGIMTMGGKDVYYDHEDLNGTFVTADGSISTNAAYNYTWGDDTYSYRGCGWYTGKGMTTVIDANKDANVASASGYSGANAYNLMMRKPVEFEVSWNSTSKCPEVKMTGNTFGATFRVYVGMVYTSSCTAANNTSSSSTKYTYTVTVPEKKTTVPGYSYKMTGESYTASLPSYATVEGQFSTINKNYWHENCTNAINLRSNRFSQMAMPESVEYVLSIVVEDANLWVPVQIKKTEPASSITASSIYTFYSNTARGTYADTSSMTNPDGSSRGSDSNVSSQASKYGDYTKATASYKVKFSTLHDTYWNWYNM